MAGAVCPHCGEPISETDVFCESCGKSLTPSLGSSTETAPEADPVDLSTRTHVFLPGEAAQSVVMAATTVETPNVAPTMTPGKPCAVCGGAIAADGYCSLCGTKAISERDHWTETPAPWVGAVCDRGIRHYRNEDGMAIAADERPGSFALLVVCDGVSSSSDGDLASLAAARAARDVVLVSRDATLGQGPDAWTQVLEAAAEAANAQAAAVYDTATDQSKPPACTFVTGLVDGPMILAGWVGDSRAYWFPEGGTPLQLTEDDSWSTEEIARGAERAAAEADPRSHSITRWMGQDSPGAVPRTSVTPTNGAAGWLLVCSDGLWNYCSNATDLAVQVVNAVAARPDSPVGAAGLLVDWANAQGGHDNVTVALAHIPAISIVTNTEPVDTASVEEETTIPAQGANTDG